MKEIIQEYGEGMLGAVGATLFVIVVLGAVRVFLGDAFVDFIRSI
jgi:hypothetical protein